MAPSAAAAGWKSLSYSAGTAVSPAGSSGRTGTRPLATRNQRLAASSSSTATHAITKTVMARLSTPESTWPCWIRKGKVPGPEPVHICTPAVIVVEITNSIGRKVTGA